jgi:hypothetical protein
MGKTTKVLGNFKLSNIYVYTLVIFHGATWHPSCSTLLKKGTWNALGSSTEISGAATCTSLTPPQSLPGDFRKDFDTWELWECPHELHLVTIYVKLYTSSASVYIYICIYICMYYIYNIYTTHINSTVPISEVVYFFQWTIDSSE